MKEADLQKHTMKKLKEYFMDNKGNNVYFFNTADGFTKGVPDILLCVCGQFVAIELKVGNNKLTDLQKHILYSIKKAGGIGEVAWSWEEVRDIINKILKKNNKNLLK